VSLAAVTMTNFRPRRALSWAAVLSLLPRQRFLNLRTYVRYRDEPGVLFLWGWLSRPFSLRFQSRMFGLSYAFATAVGKQDLVTGKLKGVVSESSGQQFAYQGSISQNSPFEPCPVGSLGEFAMERYTGYFCKGSTARVFRVWHPPWSQAPIEPTLEDTSLVTRRFPWFASARLASAHLVKGFRRVWLGGAHRLPACSEPHPEHPRVLSAFYEMP